MPRRVKRAEIIAEPVVEEKPVVVEEAEVVPDAVEEPKKTGYVYTNEGGDELDTTAALRDVATEIDSLAKSLRSLTAVVRKLAGNHTRELRAAEKSNKRRRDPNRPKKAPSGITKPAPISKGLSSFLGVPEDTELARVEVTKRLNKYFNDHNLKNPDNKKIIMYTKDKNLKKLFTHVPKDEELTFFNLQRYMKVHYPKK